MENPHKEDRYAQSIVYYAQSIVTGKILARGSSQEDVQNNEILQRHLPSTYQIQSTYVGISGNLYQDCSQIWGRDAMRGTEPYAEYNLPSGPLSSDDIRVIRNRPWFKEIFAMHRKYYSAGASESDFATLLRVSRHCILTQGSDADSGSSVGYALWHPDTDALGRTSVYLDWFCAPRVYIRHVADRALARVEDIIRISWPEARILVYVPCSCGIDDGKKFPAILNLFYRQGYQALGEIFQKPIGELTSAIMDNRPRQPFLVMFKNLGTRHPY